ncbi:MAG: 16S rRNA (uracil(1498)-N(3))-methyltransferase [Burkholderiaceae bacterium]
MRAARFFVDEPLAINTRIVLPEGVAHHALRVMRLREGDPIVLFNGTSGEFAARLSVTGSHAYASIDTFVAIERESPLRMTLVQSWVAADKLEWTIEKAVELGVYSILLAPAQRCVVRLTGDRLGKRIEHLRELIVAACAQCGRNRLPHIEASPTLAASLRAGLSGNMRGVLLHPNADTSLAKTPVADGVAIAVGPEGGFDDDEVTLAHQLGYAAYRLGPRVLRTETAGLAALAALQTVGGDFS